MFEGKENDFFRKHFPDIYLERLLKSLFDCYEHTVEYCFSNFAQPEATNLMPFQRRARIEGMMREIASGIPEVSATPRRSPSSQWNHTLVMSERVAITQNAACDPNGIVRPSIFREWYASRDNQRFLFKDMEPDNPAPDSVLYGILIHGRSPDSHNLLGFANIVFPKEDLKSYSPYRIDLFSEFPQIVRECTEQVYGVDEEQVAEPLPELRTDFLSMGDGA